MRRFPKKSRKIHAESEGLPNGGVCKIFYDRRLGAWLSGRASPSHGGGQWFESTSAHQPNRRKKLHKEKPRAHLGFPSWIRAAFGIFQLRIEALDCCGLVVEVPRCRDRSLHPSILAPGGAEQWRFRLPSHSRSCSA
jgi:hypothetical protein